MKRVIKFRGKRLTDGKWIYGDFFRNRRLAFIAADVIVENPLASWQDYNVDPDTVGQFTGLYDREGNEIFEGDVVTGLEYADFHTGDDGNVNAVVVWDTEWASFMLDAGCRVNIRPCADIRRRIRVTGNIHDNPSLLEGGLKCFTL